MYRTSGRAGYGPAAAVELRRFTSAADQPFVPMERRDVLYSATVSVLNMITAVGASLPEQVGSGSLRQLALIAMDVVGEPTHGPDEDFCPLWDLLRRLF